MTESLLLSTGTAGNYFENACVQVEELQGVIEDSL